mmetsp:Transcript_11213/g.18872  ORF Transcript_11213/g.18872 Transcript_11213/m.18872 type:complete len:137 (-) Transcript_11213:68-478(-)
MSQRIQEYMMVKIGEVDEPKLKKIMQLKQFKEILKENLDEFSDFYSAEVLKQSPSKAREAVEKFVKKMNLQTGQKKPNQMQFVQDVVYEAVETLNQSIFNQQMSKIKQMMTIAIMETQALLDTLVLDSTHLKFISN